MRGGFFSFGEEGGEPIGTRIVDGSERDGVSSECGSGRSPSCEDDTVGDLRGVRSLSGTVIIEVALTSESK